MHVGKASCEWGVGVICNAVEEDLEAAEKPMHLEGKSHGVAWPVNVGTFDKMDDTDVEHIENGNGSLLPVGLLMLVCTMK